MTRRGGRKPRSSGRLCLLAGSATGAAAAAVLAPPATPGAAVTPYVAVDAPLIALVPRAGDRRAGLRTHRTTAPCWSNRGKIRAIQAGDAPIPTGAQVLDLTGRTVLPGLVGMHDHMYYIARPDLDAEGHSRAAAGGAADDLSPRHAPLSGGRGHHPSHHGQRGALRRPQREDHDRRRNPARPAHGRHRALPWKAPQAPSSRCIG